MEKITYYTATLQSNTIRKIRLLQRCIDQSETRTKLSFITITETRVNKGFGWSYVTQHTSVTALCFMKCVNNSYFVPASSAFGFL